MIASEAYRLKILPAGRNDRMAEISDSEGNVLKYIYCPHHLTDNSGGLDTLIRQDFDALEADEFAAKYDIPPTPRSAQG